MNKKKYSSPSLVSAQKIHYAAPLAMFSLASGVAAIAGLAAGAAVAGRAIGGKDLIGDIKGNCLKIIEA